MWGANVSRDDNYPFLDTMNEVLEMTAEFVEEARQSSDDVRLGAYLKMASRCLRCALEMYGEHLERGEQSANVQNDDGSDGGGIHRNGSATSWTE
jgi:hypothetical protein